MNRSTKAWKRIPLAERKAIDKHHELVRSLPCVVTGRSDVTLHHCHSGSLGDNGIKRGGSQRPSDWLVIPLVLELHVGNGIDGSIGVRTWEQQNGTQMDHLKSVFQQLGYNGFKVAGYEINVPGIDDSSVTNAEREAIAGTFA